MSNFGKYKNKSGILKFFSDSTFSYGNQFCILITIKKEINIFIQNKEKFSSYILSLWNNKY